MVAISAATATMLGWVPSRSIAADGLSNVPFAIGADRLFDERRNDGRQGTDGHWTLEAGRTSSGLLRLRIVIDPPAYGLPVESGPAILFAGLQAYGGSGDMGFAEPIDALANVVLPSCDRTNCQYVADIELPTADILGAIQRLEGKGNSLMWISSELTLVRTFAGGTWLQVMPFMAGDREGGLAGQAGRLGAIEPVSGALFPFGLFPAEQATPVRKGGWMFTTRFDYARLAERLRAATNDATQPIETAPGRLQVDFTKACDHAVHLTLHDDAGDHIFDVDAYGKERIEADVEVPVGIAWRLTVHDGGGIDFDQGRHGWGIRMGRIETDGSPITINATFACAGGTGTIDVVGGVPDPSSPSPPPEAPNAAGSGAAKSATPAAVAAPTAGVAPVVAATGGELPWPIIGMIVALAVGGLILGLGARRGVRRSQGR